MKRIAIEMESNLYKIALLEKRKLVEFYIETSIPQRAGSLYKGRVVNVLPGMDAVFVDIGKGKNAFLHINDLLPAHADQQPTEKPPIERLVQVGDELLVQIMKEPSGTKGAKITKHYSLPGRWIVYMPGADYVALSRKIEKEQDKERLRSLVEGLRNHKEGLIVRTIAQEANKNEIVQELQQLRNQWKRIKKREAEAQAPVQIYEEMDIHYRLVRDLLTEEVSELAVDDERIETELRRYITSFAPTLVHKVKLYPQTGRLFEQLGITEQVQAAFSRKVVLTNGSYLVIDHTEALTVIDVNTGKYIGSSSLNETVFQVNLEAAQEIGRLIRLRDLGGLIIVDFIDMDCATQRDEILRVLRTVMKKDRNRAYVIGWTALGLLEITRKKVRNRVSPVTSCPQCQGTGIMLT